MRGVRRLSWLIYCCHPRARETLPEMRIREQCDQLRTAVTTTTSTMRAERKNEPTQQKAGDATRFSWNEHFQKAGKGVCVRASPQQWRVRPCMRCPLLTRRLPMRLTGAQTEVHYRSLQSENNLQTKKDLSWTLLQPLFISENIQELYCFLKSATYI